MDYVCSLDWGIIKDILVALISAGIPSLVAWKIFRGWNNQKGTEVLALEAKEVVINLSILQDLQCAIDNDLFYVFLTKKADLTKRNEFESIYNKLVRSIDFIIFALDDQDLKNKTSKLLSEAIIFLRDIDRVYEGSLRNGKIKLIDPKDALAIKKIMLDLSLYKSANKKYSKKLLTTNYN